MSGQVIDLLPGTKCCDVTVTSFPAATVTVLIKFQTTARQMFKLGLKMGELKIIIFRLRF